MSTLLEVKKALNRKRPKFRQPDAHRRSRLGHRWRAQRGMHSKARRKFRGKTAHPGTGYASPRAVRGMTRQGLMPVEIGTPKDMAKVDPKTDAIVVKKVGTLKLVEILKQAVAKKIFIINIKKPEEIIKKAEEQAAKRKAEKQKKQETKKQKKEEALKKAEEKKKKEEKETKAEEKKEAPETAKGAKSDKIKILEKKQ